MSPSELLLGRKIRTVYDLLRPGETIEQRVLRQQMKQKAQRDPKFPRILELQPRDSVMIRNYARGAEWIPATIEARTGPVSYEVRTPEGQQMKRHQDQILTREAKDEPIPIESEKGVGPELTSLRRSTREIKIPDRLDL